MPEHPTICDESVMMRWMQREINQMNASIVVDRKTLAVLSKEEKPSARTKGGKEYGFDQNALRILREQIPAELIDRLRLPILFYFDMDVPDSCVLTDEWAVRALQALGEISLLRTPQQGRVWVSRPIVYAIMRKYPTLIQIVMG